MNTPGAGLFLQILAQIPPVIAFFHAKAILVRSFCAAPGRDLHHSIRICPTNGVFAVRLKKQKAHGPQDLPLESSRHGLTHQGGHSLLSMFLRPSLKPILCSRAALLIRAVAPEIGCQFIKWMLRKAGKIIPHGPHRIGFPLCAAPRQCQKVLGLQKICRNLDIFSLQESARCGPKQGIDWIFPMDAQAIFIITHVDNSLLKNGIFPQNLDLFQ